MIALIALGRLLGPSVFGLLFPVQQQLLFPASAQQAAMLSAVSQLGIILILLLTGMETDLAVVRNSRRAALSVSLMGIFLPLGCGILLGE